MRGGKVLSIFWHSSEMLPGASPHTPDEEAANTFLEKTFKFGRWLNENYNVKAITMRELYQMAPDFSFDDYAEDSDNRDWLEKSGILGQNKLDFIDAYTCIFGNLPAG